MSVTFHIAITEEYSNDSTWKESADDCDTSEEAETSLCCSIALYIHTNVDAQLLPCLSYNWVRTNGKLQLTESCKRSLTRLEEEMEMLYDEGVLSRGLFVWNIIGI